MPNLDTFLSMSLLIHFAEAYSEGSYGGGGYSATSSTPTTTQQTSSSTTPQTNEKAPVTVADDQPISSTDTAPHTTTSQPATRLNETSEVPSLFGLDPITIVIGAAVTITVLGVIIALIVKKITRS